MSRSKNYNEALNLFNTLSQSEKDALVQEIMQKMGYPGAARNARQDAVIRCDALISEAKPHRPDCPYCGAKADLGYIIKKGMHKGSQRYLCKSCGRKFVSTTNTAFSRTRKDAETWWKFISMTIAGCTIRDCAAECKLSIQTAFTWRHKIMNAFASSQEELTMSGTVEVDEMLVPISYKGNHIQGGFGKRSRLPGISNGLPRRSFHRGSDNKSASFKSKACVFCMVANGNKAFYASVPGLGYMTPPMLDATVKKHVDKENTMMLADGYLVTQKHLRDNGYQYTILPANTSNNPNIHKPAVQGGLHLQHVNAMHHRLRDFLRPYCGVSSKYLGNYVAMFVWLTTTSILKQKQNAGKSAVACAAVQNCYITWDQLHSRPMEPKCA